MIKTIPYSVVFLATVAMIYFHPGKLCAQSPPALPADGSLRAIITSQSGAERYLFSQQYALGRVGLAPNQLVTVTLQFSSDQRGNLVEIGSLDGGAVTVDNVSQSLTVREDETASFGFQAGFTPGVYRLLVQFGATQYRLQFYVLDLVHPQNNPPRVRIVY